MVSSFPRPTGTSGPKLNTTTIRSIASRALVVLLLVLTTTSPCDAWTMIPMRPYSTGTSTYTYGNVLLSGGNRPDGRTSSKSTATRLCAMLPEGYQEFGEAAIRRAGRESGIEKDDELTIEWKAGKIIVTVHGSVYVSAKTVPTEDGDADADADADEEEECDDGDDDDDDDDDAESTPETMVADDIAETDSPIRGVDLPAFARAINTALDDDGMGLSIAEVHEIEVTTPGATEELQDPVMFEAYKGFDVICRQEDNKTKKVKTVEGRLVERNDEFTILNIKGRTKKMKNDTVLSVKLPKAKTEKGRR